MLVEALSFESAGAGGISGVAQVILKADKPHKEALGKKN